MGFCLLENADMRGLFCAINPSHVEAIESVPGSLYAFPAVHVRFALPALDFPGVFVGDEKTVKTLLMKALKLGINRVESTILGGMNHAGMTPLLINHPERVVLARELMPEDFPQEAKLVPVASHLYFSDRSVRKIAQRPGIFAMRANQGGKVPMLEQG